MYVSVKERGGSDETGAVSSGDGGEGGSGDTGTEDNEVSPKKSTFNQQASFKKIQVCII